MKRLALLWIAAAPVPAQSGSPPAASCAGYYVTPKQDGGFSVKVEPTVVEIVSIDYSPPTLSRYHRNRDGSLTFHVEGGAPTTLRCKATGATIFFPAETAYLHNPEQRIDTPAHDVRLVRFTGDIFKYAAKRGWAVGD